MLCLSFISLSASPQGLSQLVYEIRNPKTDANHFRSSLEKIGEYLALNVLEELTTELVNIETLTGVKASHHLVVEDPVLITILRAGLPLNAGVQKIFPNSEVGFFAMSRDEKTLKAKTDYIAVPNLKDRIVIISDTMLATGGSLLDAINVVKQYQPKKIYVIAAISSEKGIARVKDYDATITIYSAAVDPTLNEQGYIIPGLGDAGDRAYGRKYLLEEQES